MVSLTKIFIDFRQVVEAVTRFTPREQATLASRIQKNLEWFQIYYL